MENHSGYSRRCSIYFPSANLQDCPPNVPLVSHKQELSQLQTPENALHIQQPNSRRPNKVVLVGRLARAAIERDP